MPERDRSARVRPSVVRPATWPVRWRIATVSALLTFVILIGFAALVGRLTGDRLRSDFREELEALVVQLEYTFELDRLANPGVPPRAATDLEAFTMSAGTQVRIVDGDGEVYAGQQTRGAPDLGPPDLGLTRRGRFQIISMPLYESQSSLETGPLFVQVARDRADLEQTIDRLWFFLAGGTGVGTVLAAFGGFMVAGRAMAPVSALTGAAREIATTRDPSMRIPEPETEDEVGELARTLDQMLRELDAARTETQETIQRQREFVADASHELRTPLTSILANLELLQAELEAMGEGSGRDAVDSALRSSKRMSRLVADLLILARADAGRIGERADLDLAEIAADAVAEVEPLSDGHEVVFERDGAAPVHGNADELHRMLTNLLQNGVLHTPRRTTITVGLRRADGKLRLVVADDGPGLPEGMEEQLFERFARGRGPADVSAPGEGTGLGLSIVRAVARSHGGEVRAGRSAQGGASFEVILPASEEPFRGA